MTGSNRPFVARQMLPVIDGPDAFCAAFRVSRETGARLQIYLDLLAFWQKSINLVAPKSLPEAWHRHVADSAQLLDLGSPNGLWIDFGAGAGFPGLVIAILRAEIGGGPVSLVESDQRKCAFLSDVVRRTGIAKLIAVDIVNQRIESPATRAKLAGAGVVSARAVAPLTSLLALSAPLFGPDTIGLFPKGRGIDTELAQATTEWNFRHRLVPSRVDREGVIVEIGGPAAKTED